MPITIIQYLFGMLSGKSTKVFIALLLLGLMGYGYHTLTNHHYNKGVMDTTNQYEKRLSEEKRKQEMLRLKLEEDVKYLREDLERKQIEYQNAYERGKKDAEKKAAAIISDIESRNRRLSIEVRDAVSASRDRAACYSSPATDGTRRAILSDRASRFLITQATLADNKVRELNLCKQTLKEMRKTVDEYNKRLKNKKNKK